MRSVRRALSRRSTRLRGGQTRRVGPKPGNPGLSLNVWHAGLRRMGSFCLGGFGKRLSETLLAALGCTEGPALPSRKSRSRPLRERPQVGLWRASNRVGREGAARSYQLAHPWNGREIGEDSPQAAGWSAPRPARIRRHAGRLATACLHGLQTFLFSLPPSSGSTASSSASCQTGCAMPRRVNAGFSLLRCMKT
jgi:hypothetical protein